MRRREPVAERTHDTEREQCEQGNEQNKIGGARARVAQRVQRRSHKCRQRQQVQQVPVFPGEARQPGRDDDDCKESQRQPAYNSGQV